MRAARRAARPPWIGLTVVTLVLAACGGGPSRTEPSLCPTEAPLAVSSAVPSGEPVPSGATPTAAITTATFETSLGSFTVTLNPAAAPVATANFVALAGCGFYDGVTFHRVLTGFVAQAGDPNTRENQDDFEGLGTGGPGYGFAIETPPEGLNYDPYTVAMANSGMPNSNGSQFFICLADLNSRLPRTYTIFGMVTDGQEVVDAIGQVEVNDPLLGVPVDPVVIRGIELGSAESTPS